MADDDTLVDEYVNGLPRRPGRTKAAVDWDDFGNSDHPVRPPSSTPQVGRSVRLSDAKASWLAVGLVVVGGLLGRCGEASTVAAAEPTPAPTVTVTVTKKNTVETKVFPESCTQATAMMKSTLPAQDAIIGQGNAELDLLDEGYMALMRQDPNEINRVVGKQREMRNKLAKPVYDVMDKRQDMLDLMDKCDRDLNGGR